MLVSSLDPKVTRPRVEFFRSERSEIPKESGCYVLTASDNTILYIGQAVDIYERIGEHLEDDTKKEKTPDDVARWVHYALCRKDLLDAVERKWSKQHIAEEGRLPYLNKRMPPA